MKHFLPTLKPNPSQKKDKDIHIIFVQLHESHVFWAAGVRVQNAAARLISNTPRFGHISPVMKDLHWLPVKYRIVFKIVVFTFKAIHGSAPTYISQLIRLKPKSTYMLRSNTKHFLLDQPRKMKKTTGDRAFLAAAPTLWNALPDDLRTLDNLKSFKSQLKTHFFKLAYNLCS